MTHLSPSSLARCLDFNLEKAMPTSKEKFLIVRRMIRKLWHSCTEIVKASVQEMVEFPGQHTTARIEMLLTDAVISQERSRQQMVSRPSSSNGVTKDGGESSEVGKAGSSTEPLLFPTAKWRQMMLWQEGGGISQQRQA